MANLMTSVLVLLSVSFEVATTSKNLVNPKCSRTIFVPFSLFEVATASFFPDSFRFLSSSSMPGYTSFSITPPLLK